MVQAVTSSLINYSFVIFDLPIELAVWVKVDFLGLAVKGLICLTDIISPKDVDFWRYTTFNLMTYSEARDGPTVDGIGLDDLVFGVGSLVSW